MEIGYKNKMVNFIQISKMINFESFKYIKILKL